MLKENWMKYGAIYVLVVMIMHVMFYYIVELSLTIQMVLGFGSMILFMVLATLKERSQNGGYLSYGECLKTSFLTALMGTLASILLLMILLMVDPGLKEKLMEIQTTASRSMMETFGMTEDQIAEAMEQVEEQGAAEFTIGKQLTNGITTSIMVFILAAFVSLFLKRMFQEEKF
ncbi:MAG: DUF4199 domain-containing protein [Saprospiraceae bacterium]|nr:DUF4199 domain-containing protein [Saprospiraceae bacterium]